MSKVKKELIIGTQSEEFITAHLEKLNEDLAYMNENVTSEWKIITPTFAKETLETKNVLNRILLEGTVNSYTNQMREGKWKTNGEPIIFSDEVEVHGVTMRILLNGQHRLAACVKSGIPFLANVISGIPIDKFDSMDTGKVRAGKDALSAAHVFDNYNFNSSEYSLASTIIKKVLELKEGRKASHGSSSTRIAPNNSDIVSNGKQYANIYVAIIKQLEEWKKTLYVEDWFKQSERINGCFMAWLIIGCGWSNTEVFHFFREVVDKKHQTTNMDTDPIEKLKERIKINIERKSKKGDSSPYTDMHMFDFYARAWNSFTLNKPLASMSRRKECADFIQREEFEQLKAKKEKSVAYSLVTQ